MLYFTDKKIRLSCNSLSTISNRFNNSTITNIACYSDASIDTLSILYPSQSKAL